jgi:hypothetical protein
LEGDLTGKEITASARIAVPAVSAVPADSDPLAHRPASDAWTDCINYSSDLMSRDARILDTRPESFLCKRIAVADATGFDLDSHPPGVRLWNFSFDNLKGAIRFSNLHDTHLRHSSSYNILHQALH